MELQNRCGEFYDKYDETRRNPWPFTSCLRECVIDAQYTMLRTPQQNDIVKRSMTLYFPGVLLTTVNLRKTCMSHIMRPIRE